MFSFKVCRLAVPVALAVAAVAALGGNAAPARADGLPRDLSTLSANDRLTLPPETIVKIRDKVFTLDALRKNHAALEASRAKAGSFTFSSLTSRLGADHSFTKVVAGSDMHLIGGPHLSGPPKKAASPAPTAAPYNVPLANSSSDPLPSDYRQFCGSMPATVCLYYPAGVTWLFKAPSGSIVTVDALIVDYGVCAAEGGRLDLFGCNYSYPTTQIANFVPPSAGFTSSGWCVNSPGWFSLTVDNTHGAVAASDAGASGFVVGAASSSSGVGNFCFTQVTYTK